MPKSKQRCKRSKSALRDPKGFSDRSFRIGGERRAQSRLVSFHSGANHCFQGSESCNVGPRRRSFCSISFLKVPGPSKVSLEPVFSAPRLQRVKGTSVARPICQEDFVLATSSSFETGSMAEVELQYPTDFFIPSDPGEARRIQEDIENALKHHRFSEKEIFSIRLAVEEALVNAIKHGNQMSQHKKVRVAYRINPERFDILIVDEGCGFDPNDVPDPTAVENLERPCGRGLMLMRHYMTQVDYNDRGNSVAMSKVRNGSK